MRNVIIAIASTMVVITLCICVLYGFTPINWPHLLKITYIAIVFIACVLTISVVSAIEEWKIDNDKK